MDRQLKFLLFHPIRRYRSLDSTRSISQRFESGFYIVAAVAAVARIVENRLSNPSELWKQADIFGNDPQRPGRPNHWDR